MRSYTAIVEQDVDSRQFVGYIPGIPGAHLQGDSLGELQANLREVLEMLIEESVRNLTMILQISCPVSVTRNPN